MPKRSRKQITSGEYALLNFIENNVKNMFESATWTRLIVSMMTSKDPKERQAFKKIRKEIDEILIKIDEIKEAFEVIKEEET